MDLPLFARTHRRSRNFCYDSRMRFSKGQIIGALLLLGLIWLILIIRYFVSST
jgi:hypothetical protein